MTQLLTMRLIIQIIKLIVMVLKSQGTTWFGSSMELVTLLDRLTIPTIIVVFVQEPIKHIPGNSLTIQEFKTYHLQMEEGMVIIVVH